MVGGASRFYIGKEPEVKRSSIVFHGTSQKNAVAILREGFEEGTYFAAHLEDAIGYGGLCVFEVAYPSNLIKNNNWQFTCESKILPEFIVRLTKYNRSRIIRDNLVLRHLLLISNQTRLEVAYTKNDMKRNPTHYSKEELTAYDSFKDR